MEERKIYLNLDGDGWLLSLYEAESPEPDAPANTRRPCIASIGALDVSGDRILAHRWNGEALVFDDARWAEIQAMRDAERPEAAWEDRIEAQLCYTAMMTDTLLEV